jgi:hypothetical protein
MNGPEETDAMGIAMGSPDRLDIERWLFMNSAGKLTGTEKR